LETESLQIYSKFTSILGLTTITVSYFFKNKLYIHKIKIEISNCNITRTLNEINLCDIPIRVELYLLLKINTGDQMF